jgi:glycosyltransferase involved in cell wall biosynthesis
MILKSLFRVSLIYTAHNVLPHNTGEKYKNIFSKIYRLVDEIIVHTSSSKVELCQLLCIKESKINAIPHGVLHFELNDNVVEGYKSVMRKKIDMKEKIVFALLGGQSTYKGADIVANVWTNTQELCNSQKCVLLVCGKVQIDVSKLELCNNVFIDNRHLSNEEFIALLGLTDVLLMPYRTISQSGLLLTAIASHTPVLVSNLPGLIEPFSISPIGWILNNVSNNTIRDKILELLEEPCQIYHIKEEANWSALSEFYDWESISRQTFSLYLKYKGRCL